MNNNKLIPNEINKLIDLIKEIGDDELSNKAHTILNRRRDLLFSFHVDADYGVQLDDIVVDSLKIIINNYMKTKELKITPPEGYEIDKENSTFECIQFKPIVKRWKDNKNAIIRGFYIDTFSYIYNNNGKNESHNHNLFATKKQAKSALAMAQISQIMANDERFGGIVTDEEWEDTDLDKYVILRNNLNTTCNGTACYNYSFLAFHTIKQRDLFLKENEDLVKDYLMIN